MVITNKEVGRGAVRVLSCLARVGQDPDRAAGQTSARPTTIVTARIRATRCRRRCQMLRHAQSPESTHAPGRPVLGPQVAFSYSMLVQSRQTRKWKRHRPTRRGFQHRHKEHQSAAAKSVAWSTGNDIAAKPSQTCPFFLFFSLSFCCFVSSARLCLGERMQRTTTQRALPATRPVFCSRRLAQKRHTAIGVAARQ